MINTNELDESIEQLIKTEHLQIFDVVEEYCDICSDFTPHHLEKAVKSVYKEDMTYTKPMSDKECVRCRENEENELDI